MFYLIIRHFLILPALICSLGPTVRTPGPSTTQRFDRSTANGPGCYTPYRLGLGRTSHPP